MFVRREVEADADRVLELHRNAFKGPVEAELVASLRAAGETIPELCWVAEAKSGVVASIVCSWGTFNGGPAVGIGPVGVVPLDQHKGFGSALMHAVIGAADSMGHQFLALLGNPEYYSRFGFVASNTLGIASPNPLWDMFFQVRTLTSFDPSGSGTFHYASSFDEA